MTTSTTLAAPGAMLRNAGRSVEDIAPCRRGRTDLENWPDIELVRRCAERDSAAMQEIVRRYQPKLVRFVGRLLVSPEDTEEAVIDVFVRVWQQAGRFEARSSFSTWLYRIAANVAYDVQHRRKTRPQTLPYASDDLLPSDTVDVEETAITRLEREQQSRVMQRALNTLSDGDRLLLVLYYIEELDYEEIREIARCTYPVLKTRLMRARQRLRAALEHLQAEVVL
jgi:RNA polymerase sigma-70 factor (ECF subfamily)